VFMNLSPNISTALPACCNLLDSSTNYVNAVLYEVPLHMTYIIVHFNHTRSVYSLKSVRLLEGGAVDHSTVCK